MFRNLIVFITLFFIAYAGASSADSSRVITAKLEMEYISKALEMYHEEFKQYPSTEEGLLVLTKGLVVDPTCDSKKTGFMKKLPVDPWGNKYQYIYPGLINSSSYDLSSFGADGVQGGEGLNSDCGNWESKECNEIRSRKNIDFTPIVYLFFIGLLLGLPIYLYKFVSNWKRSRSLGSSLKGFHLGVLIYLTFGPAIVVGLSLAIL
jgi:general secretion pathway protein G